MITVISIYIFKKLFLYINIYKKNLFSLKFTFGIAAILAKQKLEHGFFIQTHH